MGELSGVVGWQGSFFEGQIGMNCNAELQRFKAELENTWRIANDLGDPVSEDMKAFELVSLEMKFRANFPLAMFAANAVQQWIVTRNPFHIDRAVVACAEAGVEPSPALLKEIAEVAKRRLNSDIGAGTPEKLALEAAKHATLTLIANLIHSGETLEAACSKGAVWRKASYPDLKPLKASTLEKYYVDEWRSEQSDGFTKEQCMFDGRQKRIATPCGDIIDAKLSNGWNALKDMAAKERWKQIAHDMPEADNELKGERR
jgi:hypothetical protein